MLHGTPGTEYELPSLKRIMAEDTSLLQEIDDALRADKVEQFWARNSSAIITFCVMIVLASAASVLWRNHLHDLHEQQTSLLFQATRLASQGKNSEAIGIYEKAEAQGGKLAALAGLKHAEALIALGQQDKALAVYTDIAAGKEGDAPDTLRDYARLEADILTHNRAAAAGKPVAAPEPQAAGAFRRTEAELAALRALQKGDGKAASAALTRLAGDEATPLSMRERDIELIGSIKDPVK